MRCTRTTDGVVTRMGAMPTQHLRINGGYFVMRPTIFDYIHEGEELVEQPFERLIQERRLAAFRWDGFWQCMDTFKDKITFDRMEAKGQLSLDDLETTSGQYARVIRRSQRHARSHR